MSLRSKLTNNSTSDIESQEEVETLISELITNINDDVIGIESPKPLKSNIKRSNSIEQITDYFHCKREDCKRKLSSPQASGPVPHGSQRASSAKALINYEVFVDMENEILSPS